MLALTRKSQEAVVVGGTDGFERMLKVTVVVGGTDGFERMLKVTVLEIGRGKVRLGFEVDREVPVHRREVRERICDDGQPDSPAEGPTAHDA